MWIVASSYDFTPSTQENQFGIQAKVMIQPTYFSSPIEGLQQTSPQDLIWFRYTAEVPVTLAEFKVCNGIFCTEGSTSQLVSLSPDWKDLPEKWAGFILQDVHWEEGDTIHIWVKVNPVTITETQQIVTVSDPVFHIDLGESEIIKGPIERI